ncbi:MAG: S-layer homology domain-containing protein [Carnobacterium alterfunditum]
MNNNKLFLSVLSAAIITPALVVPVNVEASPVFSDVSPTSFDYTAISELAERGVIGGYLDGTFRPSETITRGQFAAFIARALDLPKAESQFKDVPKSKSLYTDISRAYKAGIVFGDTEGNFNPDRIVTRADVAVMVDRALQLKGSYKAEVNLTFTDSGSLPKYAVDSVKRLTNYKIIAGKSNNTFAPSEGANRSQSSLFVWRMLNLLESTESTPPVVEPKPPVVEPTPPPVVVEPEYPVGDARNYTYSEIESRVGEWEIIERRSGDGTIIVRDAIQEYYTALRDPNVGPSIRHHSPETYFDWFVDSFLYDSHTLYYETYPKYELISVNGVAYRDSKYFSSKIGNPQYQADIRMNNLVPRPPSESGKFLIDIPVLNQDIVTYEKNDITTERMIAKPVETASKDFMTDIKAVFADTNLVTVSSDSLTVSYAGQTLKMTVGSNQASLNGSTINLGEKVTTQNGKVLVPIQSVAKSLGLSTRKMSPVAHKIEIANYTLPVNVNDTNFDGWE